MTLITSMVEFCQNCQWIDQKSIVIFVQLWRMLASRVLDDADHEYGRFARIVDGLIRNRLLFLSDCGES